MKMESPSPILEPDNEASAVGPSEPGPQPDAAIQQVYKPTILAVDDETRNRKRLTALLEAEGYATREAGDGIEALRSMAESPPDLVLLDVMMPGMNGFAVVERLKKIGGTKAVPVILLSSLSDREARVRGLECGA